MGEPEREPGHTSATVKTNADGDTAFCVEMLERTSTCVSHFLKYAHAPAGVQRELAVAVRLFLERRDGISLVDAAKWLFCYPLAKLTSEPITNEFPGHQGAPRNPFRFSSQVKRWFRSKLYRDPQGWNHHLWYTWFQLKRAAPCVPESFIVLSAEKHRKNMVSDRPMAPMAVEDRRRALFALSPLLIQLQKQMSKEWDPMNHEYAPSIRACLEASRKTGSGFLRRAAAGVVEEKFVAEVGRGAWGQLVPAFLFDTHHERPFDDPMRLDSMVYGQAAPGRLGYVESPEISGGKKVRIWEAPWASRDEYHGVYSRSQFVLRGEGFSDYRSVLMEPTLVEGEVRELPVIEIRPKAREGRRWAEFLLDKAMPTSSCYKAETEFILEPLKVRTITKGPAAPYAVAKEWQKTIHGIMRRLPSFRLIGKTIHESDVESIRTDLPGAVWHSIDYSSATDKLDERLSASIMALLTELDEELDPQYFDEAYDWSSCRWRAAEIVRQTLRPHEVHYTCLRRMGKVLPPVQQTNGQLMGSPTSFPILCLVNLATIWAADAEFFGTVREDLKMKCLVNGDDALVHRPREWRLVHERIAAACGLAYSVGKAYSDLRYANMNSVGFYDVEIPASLRLENGPVTHVKRCSYYPIAAALGLAQKKGIGRSADCDEEHRPSPFDSLERALRDSWRPVWTMQKAIMPYLASDLAKESCWRNWFLPRVFGGMGVEPPEGWRWSVTEEQRAHAEWVWTRANGRLGPRPTPRPELLPEEPVPAGQASKIVDLSGADLEALPWGCQHVIIRDSRWLREPVGVPLRRSKPKRLLADEVPAILPLGWKRLHGLAWS